MRLGARNNQHFETDQQKQQRADKERAKEQRQTSFWLGIKDREERRLKMVQLDQIALGKTSAEEEQGPGRKKRRDEERHQKRSSRQ